LNNHGDHHHHHHHHDQGAGQPKRRPTLRLAIAAALVLFVVAAASLVQVRSGEALVVTRFGNPARVLMDPGLAWRLPVPLESTVPVDLRLRSTSSGLQDVGTRDGLRIIMQAYVVWRVQADSPDVQRFLRAVQNQPDEAARQIRAFIGSALETATSADDLSKLVNTDAGKVQIADLEEKLALCVHRMRAERETIAAERTAVGNRQAAEIKSAAEKDARIVQSDAKVKAAEIEAASHVEAATVYGKAYAESPQLYNMVRSLDTLSTIVTPDTKLILRTDAAPFRALVEGPPAIVTSKGATSAGGR